MNMNRTFSIQSNDDDGGGGCSSTIMTTTNNNNNNYHHHSNQLAIPALIVEVLPNLLTYSSIMISIILAIYYGVLYMNYRYQPPTLFSIDNNNNSYHHGIMMIGKYNRTNLPYDYLSQMAESSRFNSVNYHPQPPPSTTLSSATQHHQPQPSATEYLNIFEPSTLQPRRSCQF
ncbi:uncharacterized protein LOC142645941 [Dermatophagoides pteronyssinus]|uniref:uncharacterized protein LOC142645941 n=1 Tax=Dermatophagoides pteronyssinus TaxID=6956 RepID=UPI003F6736C8